MARPCMASSGMGSLIFVDVTRDGSRKMNSETFVTNFKDETKLIGGSFIRPQNNDPKHAHKQKQKGARQGQEEEGFKSGN